MRIAVLTNAFGATGGAGRLAELHVQMLQAAGHEVKVFQPNTDWLKWPAPVRAIRHLMDLLSHRVMVDKIIGWHPDVLLTHNLTGCGFGTPSAIKSERTRWVHVLHDVQLFQPNGRLRDAESFTPWQKLWVSLRKRFLGTPDLVISPTGWMLEQHMRRGLFSDAGAEVLPNPAPAVSFALRAPSQPLKLFFLGHTPEKGKVIIEKLQARISDPIRVIMQAPNNEVLDAMREADVMLFPSQIVENQPIVLLEAMSLGLPVIASDTGGVRETLKGAGIVVQRDDVDAWVLAINRLRDPEEYREQSVMMYERAKEYDADIYAKRFLNLIASLQT